MNTLYNVLYFYFDWRSYACNMKAELLCCFLYTTTFVLVVEVNSLIQGSYGGICLNECDRHGYTYSYCETTAHRWDYCSNIAGVTSYTYGKVCRENHQCGFHNEDYLWCYYDDNYNWGYCSLYPDEPIVTSEGKACKKNDPCSKSIWFWNWCYTDDDSNWGYCKPTSTITYNDHLSSYGYHCKDSCEMHGRDKYNKCMVTYYIFYWWRLSSPDYCSVNPDFTYQGDACRPDHPCDRYGEIYYWCYNQKGSWDYCSPIENCGYWPPSPFRVKRQQAYNVICTVGSEYHNFVIEISSRNQIETRFRAIAQRTQMLQVTATISEWDRNMIDRGLSAGTLCETPEYRIDLQCTFIDTATGSSMANIQIQSNGQNSQSVAGIIVPVGVWFPERRFRRALTESAQRQTFITMKKVPNM